MATLPSEARAVFFDAVGTLLFTDPPACVVYAETARRYGLTISPDEVRPRFVVAFQREEEADAVGGWVTSEERELARWRSIVTDTLAGVNDTDECFRDVFDHFARPGAWRVSSDTPEVIAALHSRGYVLGIGSNYDTRLWQVLGGFPELKHLRDRVVISAAVGVRKPAGRFFEEVVRAADCEPAQVLFVGDELVNDYEGATAAGLQAVLLDPDAKHRDVPHHIMRLTELIR